MNVVRTAKNPQRPPAREALRAAVFLAVALIMTHDAIGQEGGRSGKDVVEAVCAACHAEGLNGAPRIGDREAWGKRAAQGLTSLTRHALQGIRQMPAHGGNLTLTDLEIGRAVTYIVNRSGGNWVEPASAEDMAAPRGAERIVTMHCSKCHQTGEGGAPRIGDRGAWIPRLSQGFDHLVQSAIRGHGGMPPRGGMANLTDAELRSAIVYMFNPVAPPAGGHGMKRHERDMAATRPDPNHRTAGNLDIYLGVMAAKNLLSLPRNSPETSMHGGVPSGDDYHHINITLLDRKRNVPISGANVDVVVEEPGLTRVSTILKPMTIGASSYGNYVTLKPHTTYLITVRVQIPGSPRTTEVRFEHGN